MAGEPGRALPLSTPPRAPNKAIANLARVFSAEANTLWRASHRTTLDYLASGGVGGEFLADADLAIAEELIKPIR